MAIYDPFYEVIDTIRISTLFHVVFVPVVAPSAVPLTLHLVVPGPSASAVPSAAAVPVVVLVVSSSVVADVLTVLAVAEISGSAVQSRQTDQRSKPEW